jgi:hypothetical protein
MKITVDTKVGELIPEGKYCTGCFFEGEHDGEPWCSHPSINSCLEPKYTSKWVLKNCKLPACPKPPVEVKD